MAKGKSAGTGRKGQATTVRASEVTVPHSDPVAEAAAWTKVETLAIRALEFWNSFIGLRSGSSALDPAGLAHLSIIIRAVSWVESRHGTGTRASSTVDPMQCANPRDAWWIELTDCSGRQDRFVRGPGLAPNYNAGELPNAVASNPSFPVDASLSKLSSRKAGHDNAGFSQTMSYVWGVPFLIYKINKTAGDSAFQCKDLSRDRLVDGAVAYNGSGDPRYREKVTSTIDMIGGLPAAVAEFTLKRTTDAQKIIDFCDQEYSSNKDDCNKFVKAVSADLNITLFQPGDDADAIVQRMRNAGWLRPADGVEGKAKADGGLYVIAGLKGADHTPPRQHGHVAVVVSGPLADGKYPTGYWGSLGGTPGRDQTLNLAWRAADRDNVEYYAKDL